MNKKHGGSQPAMRSVEIKSEDQLGSFDHDKKLGINQIQTMVFADGDVGPCYMTPAEQTEKKYDVIDPSGKKDRYVFTKPELQAKLSHINKSTTGKKKDIQERCQAHGIPIWEERPHLSNEGWVGKPKGMLQVLWERGYIDPNLSEHERWKCYPVGCRKNNLGELIPGTGLREMVSSLPDFQNEVTLLEHHAVSRSTVDCKIHLIRSPKCHPEIAGEGIEYDWAAAKSKYRRAPLAAKANLKSFKALVHKCLKSLDLDCRYSFSARAWEYMLEYDVLAHWETLPEEIKSKEQLPETSAKFLDGIVNTRRKSHRGVKSEDGWVNDIMETMRKRDVIIVDDD